jgi:flagellar biosynthesis/type III secretory pathway M-ring protein FliF/YscJ
MSANITLAFFDNTDPGIGGWLVLAVWFVLFVLVLNTIIFALRRLFRRRRDRTGQAPQPTDSKGMT